MLKKIFRLSVTLAIAEIKLRNEDSYLGIIWYLLNPLLIFGLLLTVFSTRLGQNIPQYPLYLLLGIIMFNFFQRATMDSTRIIQDNKIIIKSIHFPYTSLIGSIILKILFSHLIEIALFGIVLAFFHISPAGILLYPLVLAPFCLFTAGIAFMLCALTAYIVDLENIWLFASRLLWFFTPIFYAIESGSRLHALNAYNPLFHYISIAREMIIYGHIPAWWNVAAATGYALLSLAIGLAVFNNLKSKFAELI
ncbi:MAG: hypothetical protein GF350_02700 [Chitinivibrionales bacterium]|nr:hypothetical protein [Chitinivibrionales bacterium]